MRLADANHASVGELVITRANQRSLRISGSDWVKNGDRWLVLDIGHKGDLIAAHTRTRRRVTLPASYVAESVELGYATTVHGAQGVSVDVMHGLATGQESRQQLLPRTHPADWIRDARDVDDAVRREHGVRRGYVPTIQTLDPDALVLHHGLDRHARPPRRGERGVAWQTAAISAAATRRGWASGPIGPESGQIQWVAQRNQQIAASFSVR